MRSKLIVDQLALFVAPRPRRVEVAYSVQDKRGPAAAARTIIASKEDGEKVEAECRQERVQAENETAQQTENGTADVANLETAKGAEDEKNHLRQGVRLGDDGLLHLARWKGQDRHGNQEEVAPKVHSRPIGNCNSIARRQSVSPLSASRPVRVVFGLLVGPYRPSGQGENHCGY
jgi:hypothetical protein